MRIALLGLICLGVLAASYALYQGLDFTALSIWVTEQQRAFQNQMASAIRALKSGDMSAYAALFAATGAYGFVHALGPGHGKYLVGGVGLGTTVSASKLVSIAVASSLAQSLWAILLVYGGFSLLEISARQLTFLAEDVLAPASYLAIGAVGLMLVWRGLRALKKQMRPVHSHAHAHDHGHAAHTECGCGHHHGPTHDEVEKVGSLRDAVVLIASIAVRPCTGAVFLLVIAWQMDIRLAGGLATLVMGLGTAALTSLVAVSSIAARRIAFATADHSGVTSVVFPAGQVFFGGLIMWISLGLLVLVL